MTEYELAVVVGDLQIPFHSVRAVKTWLAFLEHNRVHLSLVVLNGDVFDFPYLSLKFLRDPKLRFKMQDDLATFQELRAVIDSTVMAGTRKVFVAGNHEARWDKYIQERADEFAWLAERGGSLSLSSILGTDWEFVAPYGEGLDWHGLFITHGTSVSQHSGMAARDELRRAGTSGISGHTHRGGAHFHTDRAGAHAWYEGFCLCNVSAVQGPMPPSQYGIGVRNQQQGIVVVEWLRKGRAEQWSVHPLAMVEQRLLWNGVLYTPKGVELIGRATDEVLSG